MYTINISTAVATFIGDTGAGAGGGLGFAPNGTLYQTSFNSLQDCPSLNTISPVDAHRITTVPVDKFYDGLGVRYDGVLFATPGASDEVDTIDPVNGAITFIGNTGQGNLSDVAFRLYRVLSDTDTHAYTYGLAYAYVYVPGRRLYGYHRQRRHRARHHGHWQPRR